MGFSVTVDSQSPFTIHNIPFGVISTASSPERRCASALGAYAIDLVAYAGHGHLNDIPSDVPFKHIFAHPSLNAFAALPRLTRSAVRTKLASDLSKAVLDASCFVPLDQVTMHLPMAIGGFSDFYCSLEHVQNCSPMAAGATIPTNWFYAPSVYNGRASSIVPSPANIRRPRGVYFDDSKIGFRASKQLDYELEMGFFVSKPIERGAELDIADVEEHIFGFTILNDWSARDLQLFEMKPLGPFHGKGFGTSVSPWIVTLDALTPFACKPKTTQDPAPLDHLRWPNLNSGTFDIKLQVELIRNGQRFTLGKSNLRYLYWTPFQQLTHHASAMCGLGTGDLIGTGTISGDGVDEQGNKTELGCLYEATQGGTKSMTLAGGSHVDYLEDADEIVMSAWCGGDGRDGVSLGFGECRGVLLPALT